MPEPVPCTALDAATATDSSVSSKSGLVVTDMGEIDPIGFVESAPGLDDSERRAILGRNAARLLNLEMPPVHEVP